MYKTICMLLLFLHLLFDTQLIRKFCCLTNCDQKSVKYNYSHDYSYNKNADIQK